MQQKIELLSPAGSFEGFLAVINAGADAVYLGGELFGARAYAKNLTQEEIMEALNIAHFLDKKIYLTVNTLIKNIELYKDLYNYIKPLYENGLDGVIVQDLGVAKYLKDHFPSIELHASTQMAVTGVEGSKLLEDYGFSRVVPARELGLDEIKSIRDNTNLEIETFIHGALCYSYSGMCLMSSLIGGRSGNRGRCAQPCRLPYKYNNEKDEKNLLSPKDICTLDILPEIIKAGVTSLKIEGRMKQSSYTKTVTEIYRKYLNKIINKEKYIVELKDRDRLISAFSRGGSSTGYYLEKNGPNMMAFKSGKKIAIKDAPKIVQNKEEKPKRLINGQVILYSNCPITINLETVDKKYQCQVLGDEIEPSDNCVSEERLKAQLNKMGNTYFEWKKLELFFDENIFIPVSVLNKARRQAVEAISKEILKSYYKTDSKNKLEIINKKNNSSQDVDIYVNCNDNHLSELEKIKEIKGFYLSINSALKNIEKLKSFGKEVYIKTPLIQRRSLPKELITDIDFLIKKGLDGILVSNMETFGALVNLGLNKYIVIDHSLYTWNNEAIKFFDSYEIKRNTVPLELNQKELLHRDNYNSEILVYGYLPMMLSTQCIQKNVNKCTAKNDLIFIKDRVGNKLSVKCKCNIWEINNTVNKDTCYNIIYNPLAFGLLKESKEVLDLGIKSIRLDFTIEKNSEVKIITEKFINQYKYGKNQEMDNLTKGHFKRGVL